jgi:hypothetical protein
MNYSSTVHTVLDIGRGATQLKVFVENYKRCVSDFAYAPLAFPAIVLMDNDPFYYLGLNLYLIKTPEQLPPRDLPDRHMISLTPATDYTKDAMSNTAFIPARSDGAKRSHMGQISVENRPLLGQLSAEINSRPFSAACTPLSDTDRAAGFPRSSDIVRSREERARRT